MESLIAIVAPSRYYARLMDHQEKLPKPGTVHHLLPKQIETHLNPLEANYFYSTIITTPKLLTEVLFHASPWISHLVLLSATWEYSDLTPDQEELLGKFEEGFRISNATTIRDTHTHEDSDSIDRSNDE